MNGIGDWHAQWFRACWMTWWRTSVYLWAPWHGPRWRVLIIWHRARGLQRQSPYGGAWTKARIASALYLPYGFGRSQWHKNAFEHKDFAATDRAGFLGAGGSQHDKRMRQAQSSYARWRELAPQPREIMIKWSIPAPEAPDW